MSDDPVVLSPETFGIHGAYDPFLSEGSVMPPWFVSSTYVARSAAELAESFRQAYGLDGKGARNPDGLIYARLVQPNAEIFERRIVAFEQAEEAALFASGMAAIATVLLTFCKPGDQVLFSEPVYGGTDFLLNHFLKERGIEATGFDAQLSADDVAELIKGMTNLRVVFLETPANPTLVLADVPGIARVVREHAPEALVIVDNTLFGPVFQRSLELGADLSVYSATKIIGGHSDLIAGLCMGPAELVTAVKASRTILGTMSNPLSAALLTRSLATLKIRVEASAYKAEKVAMFLRTHPRVDRLYYPSFETNEEQGRRYEEQCYGGGSLISFDVTGGCEEAYKVLDALKVVKLAVSMGGVESLAEHPRTHTHSDVSPEDQDRFGITPNMIRLSVGLEDADDIIADLRQALATLG